MSLIYYAEVMKNSYVIFFGPVLVYKKNANMFSSMQFCVSLISV